MPKKEVEELIAWLMDTLKPDGALHRMRTALAPLDRGPHPLTGKTVKTKDGDELLVKGWFEQVFGTPYIWTELDRPPFIIYFCRIMDKSVPFDNDVVVVRGHSSSGLLHNSEIIEMQHYNHADAGTPPTAEANQITEDLPPPTAVDNFHAHLAICKQCRNNPMFLCPVGGALLQHAAESVHGQVTPVPPIAEANNGEP